MKNFWALPAFLRITLASQHAFSVFDDLFAFPQYEVIYSNNPITEHEATALLSHTGTRSTTSATPSSQESSDLSKLPKSSPVAAKHGVAVDETYEAVVLDGQRYLCSIPIVAQQEQNATATPDQAKDEEEKELMRATDRGWELLEGLQGSCIYYSSGWWSYSFCYKDQVKQFHQLPPGRGIPIFPPVEDTSVDSFVLGKFPKDKKGKNREEERKTLGGSEGAEEEVEQLLNDEGKALEVPRLETKGSTRYMVQSLSGGTECDLTGKERKIEVQFHCNPQSTDKINMIKETSTCSYLMIIHTPRLCNDVAFLPPQENLAHPISCQPVLSESEVDQWTLAQIEAKLVEKLKETERFKVLAEQNPLRAIDTGVEGNSPKRPNIGGVEVGAQNEVGSEGKVIEKSVVVGGGKEVKLATIATSDGMTMSAQELKKLSINDPKEIEKLKKRLQDQAGELGWKLELVDTPRGREFRGIIEAEDVEEGQEVKEKEEKKAGMKKEEKKEKSVETGIGKKNKQKGGKVEKGGSKSEEGSQEVIKDEL